MKKIFQDCYGIFIIMITYITMIEFEIQLHASTILTYNIK
jgi:hypothetical protein